jgi:hypothetical protein
MKTTISNLKGLFKQLFEAGHVDRSRRQARGYDEANADVDYLDRANESTEITEDPGVSQSKRMAHGYGLEEPADYDVPGEGIPQKEAEEVPMALRVRLHPVTPANALQAGPPLKMVDFTSGEDAPVAVSPEMEMEDKACMPSLKKILRKK